MTLLAANVEAPSEKPGLAALNFEAERGVDESLVKMLSDAALSELKSSQRFGSVIGSSDIQAMITAEQQKQAVGCEDDGCLAQLGGALGVPYLLTGSLGVLGGRFMLNLKLLNVDDARVAERVTKVFADEGALVDGLGASLDQLIKGVGPTVASAQSPSVAATVQKNSTRAKTSTKRPWLTAGFVVAGLAAVAASGPVVSNAQSEHDDQISVSSADALQTAVSVGNGLFAVGVGSIAVGAAIWLW